MEKISIIKNVFLPIFFLLIYFPVMGWTIDTKQEFIMNKLVNCKELANDTILWKDFVLDRDPTTKDFTFNLTLKVLREVSSKFALEFTIMKCDSDGSLDSCENILNNVKIADTCKILFKKGQLWTPFMEKFERPLSKCPIQEGEYSVKNVPIQKNFLKVLPIRGAMFRGIVKGYDDDVLISCVQVEMKFNRKRQSG